MSVARQVKSLWLQYIKSVIGTDNAMLKFAINEDDPYIWYVEIHGLLGEYDEFENGQYLFQLEADKKDPINNPPRFYSLTPNGIFSPGYTDKSGKAHHDICISIGAYHKESSRAVLNIGSFCAQIISSMIGWETLGHGISIEPRTGNVATARGSDKKAMIEERCSVIKEHAINSTIFNSEKYPEIVQMIEEQASNYEDWLRNNQNLLERYKIPVDKMIERRKRDIQ